MKMELVYASTRDAQERVTASQAILRGLANDGGLFYLDTDSGAGYCRWKSLAKCPIRRQHMKS